MDNCVTLLGTLIGVWIAVMTHFLKSNAQKSSGDNKNAILWTPLLITFVQMDVVGP